jgi:hypothetical protein
VEGFTSNNLYLMPFKKGAFEANCSLKPLVYKYDFDLISPMLNIRVFVPLAVLQLSQIKLRTVHIFSLPVFVPSEYLYKTHADKG